MEVKLVDSMGDDLRAVNSARVSFAKEHTEFTFRKDVEKGSDEGLIEYLAKHNHWTPFAHIGVTLHLKMPIFIARQFAKHTVGFVTNEVSRRYVDDPPEFFTPREWRGRPTDKKQGSSDEIVGNIKETAVRVFGDRSDGSIGESGTFNYTGLMRVCKEFYEGLIEQGVAPEQARMVLPQSMYTEMYTTSSLVGWARVMKLRNKPDAQLEIQELAQMIDREIKTVKGIEYSWAALTT